MNEKMGSELYFYFFIYVIMGTIAKTEHFM